MSEETSPKTTRRKALVYLYPVDVMRIEVPIELETDAERIEWAIEHESLADWREWSEAYEYTMVCVEDENEKEEYLKWYHAADADRPAGPGGGICPTCGGDI